MIQTILAIVGAVWIVGRISRRSPHHPLNSVPTRIARAAALSIPQTSSSQETAQIQGGLVAGEDGGE